MHKAVVIDESWREFAGIQIIKLRYLVHSFNVPLIYRPRPNESCGYQHH